MHLSQTIILVNQLEQWFSTGVQQHPSQINLRLKSTLKYPLLPNIIWTMFKTIVIFVLFYYIKNISLKFILC